MPTVLDYIFTNNYLHTVMSNQNNTEQVIQVETLKIIEV